MLSNMINPGSSVKLGAEVYTAYELTLREQAELEAWALSLCPSGFEALHFDAAADDYMTRLKELRGRIRISDHNSFLGHPIGLAKIAIKAVRLNRNVDAVMLLAYATDSQLRHLIKVAFGVDPVAMLDNLIRPEDVVNRPPPGKDYWTIILDRVCREFGWTPDQVLDLTPTQIGFFLRKGKAQLSVVTGPGDVRAHFKKHWKRIYGEDGRPNGSQGEAQHERSVAASASERGSRDEGTH